MLSGEVEVLYGADALVGGDGGLDGIWVAGLGKECEVVSHSYLVALVDGWLVEDGCHVSSVGIASVGLPFALLPVCEAVGPGAVCCLYADVSSVGVLQLEGCVELADGFFSVAPDDACAVGRNGEE